MKRFFRLMFAVVALAAASQAFAERIQLDTIAAVVNDEVITTHELDLRVDQYQAQLRKQNVQLPPRDIFQRQMLERLIYEKVQLQYARETSVRIDDPTLERAVSRVAENNKMTVQQFRDALKRDDIDWDRFREDIRNEMTIGRLREREVDSRIVVTEAEVEAFLKASAATGNEEVQVAHILLRAPEGANQAQWEKLQEKAEQILARARAGEDFGRLAAASSDAPDALSGGNLGWRKPDRLPTLYAEAIRMLRPGGLSPVLRSPAGLHIVKLVDQRGATASGPEEVTKTHVRHILIKTSDTMSDAEARQRLVQIRERITAGGDFAEQAKRFSADGSAPKGGDLGWISPGETVPEFERAMDALQPHEVSQPVQSPFGWHLIEVLERKTEDISSDRKRAQARNALRDRKADEAYDEFVRQLRDKAFVDLRPPFAPKTEQAAADTANK